MNKDRGEALPLMHTSLESCSASRLNSNGKRSNAVGSSGTPPKRVQRKRTKGWRMPPNTVYVGRPTKWGNPFKMGGVFSSREESLWYYRSWLNRQIDLDPTFLDPLKGKDLACWCRPDQPCHGDILLEFLERRRTYDELP